MGWTNHTPRWWRTAPNGVQLGLLVFLLPGVFLHELTHALVGAVWTDVEIGLDDVAVDVHWTGDEPDWARPATHLAPLVLGWTMGAGTLLAILALNASLAVPTPVLAYLVFQWAFYTLPVLGDLDF